MPIQGLGWTFDKAAAQYDQYRPAYPPELFHDLQAYHPHDHTSRALEIGIGTGQATAPVLASGCHVTAIEPGSRLAAIVRAKFPTDRLEVRNAAFEDHHEEEGEYDLVYSASAFHWIPEAVGYPKVYRCLKPGGAFARFASHPYYLFEGQEPLWEDIQRCYQRHMPEKLNAGKAKAAQRYDEQAAMRRSALAEHYGFTDIATRTYECEFRYSNEEYVHRLGIESDKIAMEEAARQRLLTEIRAVIDGYGGYITVRDMVDLNLARKPY